MSYAVRRQFPIEPWMGLVDAGCWYYAWLKGSKIFIEVFFFKYIFDHYDFWLGFTFIGLINNSPKYPKLITENFRIVLVGM